MSASSQCKTCDQIKNPDYSSDCDLSTCTNEESLYLNLNSGKSDKSQISSRSVIYLPNKTFSSQKVREIERDNALLAERISFHDRRPRQYKTTSETWRKATSSEINRRRHQERIGRENQILLKKIQSVKPSVKYG